MGSVHIYALGATLYKIVTGNNPPLSAEIYENGLPSLPNKLSNDIATLIKCAMSPRRKDRPQTIADFLSMLPTNYVNDEDGETEIYVDSYGILGEEKLTNMGDYAYEIPQKYHHLSINDIAKMLLSSGYTKIVTSGAIIKLEGVKISIQQIASKKLLVLRGSNKSIGSKMIRKSIGLYFGFVLLLFIVFFGIGLIVAGVSDNDDTCLLLGVVVVIVGIIVSVLAIKKSSTIFGNFKADEKNISMHRAKIISSIEKAMKEY